MKMPIVKFADFARHRKEFIRINEFTKYSRARVQLHWRGIVERDRLEGAAIKTKNQQVARTGELLVAEIDAKVGGIGIVPAELDGTVVSSHYFLFEIDEKKCLRKWLDYFIRSGALEDQVSARGSTNYAAIRPQHVLGFEMPLPPIPEQRRIVARIKELSAKIEKAILLRHGTTTELDAFFVSKRANLFQEAAESGSTRLDEICILERGKFSHRPRNDSRFFGGQHPWIQIGEIESANKLITQWSETLNDDGLAISRKFPKGTVLLSIAATIGAVGILDFDCCIPDSIVAITPKIGTDSEFIYHYLGYIRDHLEQIAPQSAQKNINLQILSPLPVPALSLAQQGRVVGFLDDLQAKVDSVKKLQEESEAELNALMPSILSRAFAGEL